jgi:hypothetical protein
MTLIAPRIQASPLGELHSQMATNRWDTAASTDDYGACRAAQTA